MKKRRAYISSNLTYGLIALFSFVFMVANSGNEGFWYDEFAQITFSGMGKSLMESLLTADPTPPLFNVMANVWYNIMPYGERWLLLLPQLATAFAVYISGKWAESLYSARVGAFTALLLGTSQIVIEQCGMEFRGYGNYLLFSALTFYFFSVRWRKKDRGYASESVFYGISLALLLYTHLFGLLLFTALLLADVIASWRQKKVWGRVLPYICAFASFVPWLIYFVTTQGEITAAEQVQWMPAPTLWETVKIGVFLCGNHVVTCLLCALGVVMMVTALSRMPKEQRYSERELLRLIPLAICVFMIGVAAVFGVMRAGKATLFVKRYFTPLFLCCVLFAGVGLEQIIKWTNSLRSKTGKIGSGTVVSCVILLSIISISLFKAASGDNPLGRYYQREAAEVLCAQPDIHNSNVAVVTTMDLYEEAWCEYYGRQQGRREGFCAKSIFDMTAEELLSYNTIYFEYGFWPERSEELDTRIALEKSYLIAEQWPECDLVKYTRE